MDIPEFLQKSLKHLAVVHAQALIPGQSGQAAAQTTLAELARLVSLASSLAFSDSAPDRGKAYEIVTRAVLVSKNDPVLCHSAAVVLTRLGNFPGLELLRRRYMKDAATLGLPPVFALEEAVRRSENTIAGIARTFTDFQTRLFHTLQKFPAASISAPTSAGKSFVFALDIAQKFRSAKSPLCIAYIVPTRALIRQVAGDVRRHLREARIENIPVRCVPLAIPIDREARGAVYVLTQERLLTLLGQSPLEGTKEIDVLLIDEAHGIMDGSRGIQLHAAIDLTRRRFPKCCVYFASPLVSNPEHLLDLFNLREGAETFTETVSPVGQNVFLVHPTKQTRTARFDILLGDEAVPVAERLLDFDLKGGTSPARRAGFALAITAHQKLGQRSCILFANGPSDAESLAKALVAEPSRSKELPVVIQEFIEFLGEHVHPEYQLIEMLRHRVAYHHSKMPGPVRAGVEDLFTDGHLRFICCTSTLLQGVNLPASDIVIENPKKGSDNPMDRSSFLNLIGRAGRLTKEFYGNIWCINPSGWDEPVFKGDSLTKLQSALEEAISDGGN